MAFDFRYGSDAYAGSEERPHLTPLAAQNLKPQRAGVTAQPNQSCQRCLHIAAPQAAAPGPHYPAPAHLCTCDGFVPWFLPITLGQSNGLSDSRHHCYCLHNTLYCASLKCDRCVFNLTSLCAQCLHSQQVSTVNSLDLSSLSRYTNCQ